MFFGMLGHSHFGMSGRRGVGVACHPEGLWSCHGSVWGFGVSGVWRGGFGRPHPYDSLVENPLDGQEDRMPQTHIITIACAKGGCTKTTTSMQLAGILTRWGRPSIVLDADVTGGATKWSLLAQQNNDPLNFPVLPVNRAMLDRRMIETQHAGKWVFIDTPPTETGIIQDAIDIADATIIPTQPSPLDLTLAGETFAATPNAVVLLTRVKKGTVLTKETLADLDGNGITRFEHVISEREAVKRMAGTSRLDMQEYDEVAKELLDFINQLDNSKEN